MSLRRRRLSKYWTQCVCVCVLLCYVPLTNRDWLASIQYFAVHHTFVSSWKILRNIFKQTILFYLLLRCCLSFIKIKKEEHCVSCVVCTNKYADAHITIGWKLSPTKNRKQHQPTNPVIIITIWSRSANVFCFFFLFVVIRICVQVSCLYIRIVHCSSTHGVACERLWNHTLYTPLKNTKRLLFSAGDRESSSSVFCERVRSNDRHRHTHWFGSAFGVRRCANSLHYPEQRVLRFDSIYYLCALTLVNSVFNANARLIKNIRSCEIKITILFKCIDNSRSKASTTTHKSFRGGDPLSYPTFKPSWSKRDERGLKWV